MQSLATLAQLKRWIPKLTSNEDDVLLNEVLVRASAAIMGNLSRADVAVRTVTETISGRGTSAIFLREWPVISVSSVIVEGNVINAATGAHGIGYALTPWDGMLPGAPQSLLIRGCAFTRGVSNVSVTQRLGYLQANEDQIVAGAAVTALQSNGAWCSDQGVVYANGGQALVRVNGAPAVGQYQLDGANPGRYIFNAADNAAEVLISYGFVPAPLAQACVEIVGEAYRRRQRIGQSSVSVDGKETVSFDMSAVNKYVAMNLQAYKRVF